MHPGMCGPSVIQPVGTPDSVRSYIAAGFCVRARSRATEGGSQRLSRVGRVTSATVQPAVFTTACLWPILAVLFVRGALTDRRVHWEKRPGMTRNDVVLGLALLVVGCSQRRHQRHLPYVGVGTVAAGRVRRDGAGLGAASAGYPAAGL